MKNIGIIITLTLFLVACSTKEKVEPGPSALNSYAQLKDLFANPPSEYRSAPLWDWNDYQRRHFLSDAGI